VVAGGREKDHDGGRCKETNLKEWMCFFYSQGIFLFQKIKVIVEVAWIITKI